MSERRLSDRLEKYWFMIKGEFVMPPYSHFNQSLIQDMWNNCLVFKVVFSQDTKMYRCEFVGENLKAAFAPDLLGRSFSSNRVQVMPGSNIAEFMDKAIQTQTPVKSSGQFIGNKSKIVKYRDCILPFSDASGTKVNHLIVAVSWRSF